MSQDSPEGIPEFVWSRMPEQTRKLLAVLSDDDGVAKIMLRPVYGEDENGEPTTSQAEIVADMFNIMRLDCKAMADAAGVEMSVQKMTPERAAELLQGLVRGEDFGLIDKFNDLEDKRERVLVEMTDEETVQEHQELKESLLFAQVGGPDDEAEPELEQPADEEESEAVSEAEEDAADDATQEAEAEADD